MGLMIEKNVSLAEFTTLKIGGAARFFTSVKSEDDIVEAVNFAEKNNLDLFILGGGSNILVADEGFDGLVLQIALRGIAVEQTEKKVLVTANAGENWDAFCKFCVAEKLQGVECLSGIPGFVGGSPVQNVGAYGQEVSETIIAARVFDRAENQIKVLSNADCGFAYRTSVFNTTQKNRYIVLAVIFALEKSGEPKIVYKDLREFFGDKNPDLQETRQAVLEIRAAKSMVVDANDPNSRSAGSFFKNPIVSNEKYREIVKRVENPRIETVPFYKADERNVKIPAAWLIENSGFHKGFHKGKVGLSTKHTLAIVNLENASANDVIELKTEIQERVKILFDIELLPEPIFVGF